jgi:hypothetical protein
MTQPCSKCKCDLVDNEEPIKVLELLRSHKSSNMDSKFPMLIADFSCKNTKAKSCDFTMHLKWKDLAGDINVSNCPKCGANLTASVFLGVVSGFYLESYCFNCLTKKNGGSVAYQK